jgi:hypothetical protein
MKSNIFSFQFHKISNICFAFIILSCRRKITLTIYLIKECEVTADGMLKLQVTGLLHGISGSLQSIRMCPALTTRNWQEYEPLMAGGTESGCVQVYNMATGIMEKELVIHSYPVR